MYGRSLLRAAITGLVVVLGATATFAQSALTAQDYAELQQLYARYNMAIDAGDGDAWAATFTPDGVFNNAATGRDALVAFVKNWRAQRKAPRHWNSNLVFTATPEGAKGTCYLILWDVSARPATVATTAVYEDMLVKTPQGWRFKSRVVRMDLPPAPAPAP